MAEDLIKKFKIRDCFVLDQDKAFNGRISNKYRSGFDAEIGDYIIYFTFIDENLSPAAIWVDEKVVQNSDTNDTVKFEKGILRIGKFCLDSGGKIFPQESNLKRDEQIIARNLKKLGSCLQLFGKDSIIKNLLWGKAEFLLVKALEKISAGFTLLDSEWSDFFGLGEGLTPSSDDFFSGFLLADRISGRNHYKLSENFFEMLERKTTRQSVQQLRFAADGFMNIKFENFINVFETKKIKSSIILKLLNTGHFSGTDILSGVWFYYAKKLRIADGT